MNQILYIENKKNKKNKKRGGSTVEIKSIVIFFAITIFLFGLVLAGEGVYAIYKGKKEEYKSNNIPVVDIQRTGTQVKIKVNHDIAINKIIYRWNEGQETVLQGKGRTQLTEIIELPLGNNTLYITIEDLSGKKVQYEKEYALADEDLQKPEIEIIKEGNNLRIVAKDETELDYMIYKWNEGEETKLEANADNPTQIEEKIPVEKGENKLTVIAVDTNNNEEIIEKTVVGSTKPTIELAQDGQNLIVRVKDEQGIDSIEFSLNGQQFINEDINQKEVEFSQPLVEGINTIYLKVTNIDGLSVDGETQATYNP